MLEFLKKWFAPEKKKSWDKDILEMFNYNTNNSKVINPYSQHHVVYSAIKSIGDATRNVPMKFVDNNDDYVDNNHIIYEIFKGSNDLIEGLVTNMQLYGEGFLYFPESKGQQLNIRNIPSSPILLSPKFMTTNLDNDGVLTSWTFNNEKIINVDQLIQIKLYNPYSAYRGLSPISAITIVMDSDYYAQKYNENFFKNSAMPQSVILLDKDAEVNQTVMTNLKQQILNKHQGISNSHLPLILQGADFKTLNQTQKELDFLESRKFNRNDILSIFGVPPFVAGYCDGGDVNRATADTSLYSFYTNTIQPVLARAEESITNYLKQFNLNIKCKFNYNNVSCLKRDYSSKVTDAAVLIQNGFSRDEVNQQLELGFDDIDDTRYLPMNLIPVDQMNTIDTDKPTKSITTTPITTIDTTIDNTTTPITTKLDATNDSNTTTPITTINKGNPAYRRNYLILQRNNEKRFKSVVKKYFFAQRKEVLKIISSSKEQKDYVEITSLLDGIRDAQDKKLIKEIKPVFEDIHENSINMALNAIGSEEVVILDYTIINSKSNKIIDINDRTWKDLRKTIYEGYNEGEAITKIADRVRVVYNNASTKRSVTIARTESNSMMNETSFNTYAKEGVPKKMWSLEAERDSHIAVGGEIRNINEPFSNGLMYPGDPSGDASETVNCRCCCIPIVE